MTSGSFPFVPPFPQYAKCPPVTEHVPLHSKSLCKNKARASGGAKCMRPLSGGVKNGKNLNFQSDFCILNELWIYSVLAPGFFITPVRNYMLLYSTLLCKKITRAPDIIIYTFQLGS